MDMSHDRRVVVTGVGLVTPIGNTSRTVWRNLIDGRSAATVRSMRYTTGEVNYCCCPVNDPRFTTAPARYLRFAQAAADAAIADARFDMESLPVTTGMSIGTSKGAFAGIEAAGCNAAAENGDPPFIRCYRGGPAAAIASGYHCTGPIVSPVAACATGTHALLIGHRMIASGRADVVLAGATEACICPSLCAAYRRMGALAEEVEQPSRACRPYDRNRSGFVIGEGAGIVVLENEEHALRRDARIRAEFRGGAMGQDIHHVTTPDPTGEATAAVLAHALDDAGVDVAGIDYINTHGTGTRLNDPAETRAITRAFGDRSRRLACSSTKPVTGHLLGAAGAVEFIISVLAMEHGIAPPTINLEEPDPECGLDYTPRTPAKREINSALSISSGFGGQVGVAVVSRYRES